AYNFTNIEDGSYFLVAKSSGFEPEWFNNKVAVSNADAVTVSAGGAAENISFSLAASAGPVTAALSLFLDAQYIDSATDIYPFETLYIRVSDNDSLANTDPLAGNTVEVTVGYQLDNENVTLSETDINTGVFEGSIPMAGSATPSIDSNTLEVVPGKTFGVVYDDPQNSSGEEAHPEVFVPVQSPVVINEIMWKGGTASTSDEWIEIKNVNDLAMNLSGWTIDGLGSGSPGTITIPPDTPVIPVDGYMIITNYGITDVNCVIMDGFETLPVVVVENSGVSLLDGGEQLVLKSSDGDIMDQANLNSADPGFDGWFGGNPDSKYSMERNESGAGDGEWNYPGAGTAPSSWHTCTAAAHLDYLYGVSGSEALVTAGATPGAFNSPIEAPTPVEIVILEYASPVTQGEAWPPLVAGVLDEASYTLLSETGQITIGKTGGSGSFSDGTNPKAAVSGRAMFDDLVYDTAENIIVTASYGALTLGVTPNPVVVEASGGSQPTGSISGTVINVADSSPLLGATVELWDAGTNGTWDGATGDDQPLAKTPSMPSNGDYSFPNVPDGTYFVKAFKPDFDAEWFNNQALAANAGQVVVTDGEARQNIDFSLSEVVPTGSISGTVINVDNSDPLTGVTVELWVAGQNGTWDGASGDDENVEVLQSIT
ncbi:MAG: lamin tail domain-containing protein, partial [bacterium]|nr:lamin tail domain-containing protein [bacterium]